MCFCETNRIYFTRKTGVKSFWRKGIERDKWKISIRFVFRENSIAACCAASAVLRLTRKLPSPPTRLRHLDLPTTACRIRILPAGGGSQQFRSGRHCRVVRHRNVQGFDPHAAQGVDGLFVCIRFAFHHLIAPQEPSQPITL